MSAAARANRALSDLERGRGLQRYASAPLQIQIEPTNRCDLACRGCARRVYDRALNPPADITDELIERIRPLFVTAEQVLLGGYGEPTLSPQLLRLAAAAKTDGARLTLVTNGLRLDPALCGALIELPLDELILSVDAADPRLLLKLRGVDLERLNANVAALNRGRGQGLPAVCVQSVLAADNLAELPALLELAARWGAQRLRAVLQRIYDPDQAGLSLLETPERARVQFERATLIARELGIELELPVLEGPLECVMPLEMLLVRADGTVHGCCSAVFNGSPYTLALGSALTEDPLELWNALSMVAFRAAFHGRGEFPAPCRECAFRKISRAGLLRPLR